MGLGIAGQQAELAGEVLDIVHHEGNAAVEIVEPPGLGQGFLTGLFGKIAGQLLTGDAQQIEILPVEPAGQDRARQHDHADQPVEVVQRDQRPGPRFGQQPFGYGLLRRGPVAARPIAGTAQLVQINDEPARTVRLEGPDRCRRQRHGGHVCGRPLPAAGQREVTLVVQRQQQAGGAVGHVGHGTDDAFVQRTAGRPAVRHGPGEAQPFLAIVIAMLEQVFAERHPQPRPQRPR